MDYQIMAQMIYDYNVNRRFIDKEAGLDLDLAYITPSLIAMGYPSKSLEAFYRNPMSDVEKCSEKSYSDQRFHGRVAQFPFPDHSPPPFQLIHPFCEDVSDWLHTTPGNVVAVHCKAGKGRTGVMICAFLVHCGATAVEAIKLYGEKRTLDGCGVTIPSQIRYIHYYEQFLESRTLNYDPRLLTLHEITIDTIPKPLLSQENGANYLVLTILTGEVKIYESLPDHCTIDHTNQRIRISITDKIVLAGDVKMMLWYDSLYKRSHLCHFHFNTTFIDDTENILDLKKHEVDKACKDKLHSIFDKDFKVNVRFSPALAQQSPLPTLDSLPNRAILLKYRNHNGPNSIEVLPPFFSTVRSSTAQKNSALALFGFGRGSGREGTKEGKPECGGSQERTSLENTPPSPQNLDEPNSNLPPISPSSPPSQPVSSNIKAIRNGAPILVHSSSKTAFKPMWSNDKDRDRDDNWDASSVSSDCSEFDSEWWYTKPPRPTVHSSVDAAAGTASASIVQPESIRTDLEAHGSLSTGIQNDQPINHQDSLSLSSPLLPLSNHLRLTLMTSNIQSNAPGTMASGGIMIPSSPSSAYRSPPHSASSPLAREIKFDAESSSLSGAKSMMSCPSSDDESAGTGKMRDETHVNWKKPPLHRDYLDENGLPPFNTENGYRPESLDSKSLRDQERGWWAESMTRWFWSAEDQKEQETNNREHP
ncbi:hypothetical protein BX616_009169 [Lobosporangium transversale]|nr:hypothetical protein BX616_009169 [Lobosporangium transversale]